MKKAAVIIVNWNGKKWLKDCLNSVYKQTYKNFDVYFVDNGSVDGSSGFVNNNFHNVKIIQLSKNTGFAEGNNIGIKEAFKDKNVEYIVCLNNDTIVDKNWLKELIKTAESNENVGSVQSKVLLSDGKTIHNLGIRFIKNLQGDKKGTIIIGYGEQSKLYNREFKIFAPCATSVLYKKEVLNKVGLFDKDFFAYHEDLDLGWRMKKKGFISMCNPKSVIIHMHSQTVGKASPFKLYYVRRNLYLAAIKNFGFIDLVSFPFRDVSYNLSNLKGNDSLKSLNSNIGKIAISLILIKSFFSIIYNAPKMLVKRML